MYNNIIYPLKTGRYLTLTSSIKNCFPATIIYYRIKIHNCNYASITAVTYSSTRYPRNL